MISAKPKVATKPLRFLHELAQRPGVVDQHVTRQRLRREMPASVCSASACDTPSAGTPEMVAEFCCWKWVIVCGTVSCRHARWRKSGSARR